MKVLNGDDSPIFQSSVYSPNMVCYRKVLKAFLGEINETEMRDKEQMNRKSRFKLNF